MAKKKATTKKKTASKTANKTRTQSSSTPAAGTNNASASTKAATATRSTKKKSTRKKTTRTADAPARGADAGAPAPVPALKPQPQPPHDHAGGYNGQQLPDEQLRKVKTGLTKRQLDAFRGQLLEKRAELIGDVESLQKDARNEDASKSFEHMADVGTDSYEQEFTLGLVESERKLLREIDDALERIAKGTYGVCVVSGEPIGKPRLEAKPWAKHSIEVAREREKRGLD